MNRKEFLNKIGFGAAFALTATCLQSCEKENTTPTGPVDFTINLNDSANAALANNGGYIIQNAVVVARTNTGAYAAATVICSHEGQQQIMYKGAVSQWYCSAHGATFDINGVGQNSNGSKGLTIYKTQLTGTSLRIYS
jgi:nitrite reductase/ring-hydroxylating ferredoxin subunit